MFYLKNFIQSLLSRPLLGGGLIITSIVMSILLMQGQNIQERLSAYYRPGLERPYFNAVINTEKLNNISGILRKLTKLPGVFKVEIVQEQEISKKVSSFITKNEINVPAKMYAAKYTGLKVILEHDARQRSISLIIEYLKRLVGHDSVGVSDIKNVGIQKEFSKAYNFIKDWFYPLLIGVSVSFWFLAILFFRSHLCKSSYLVELYQRRKNVAFKTFFSGLLCCFLLSLLTSSFYSLPGPFEIFSLVVLFIIGTIPFAKRWKWS